MAIFPRLVRDLRAHGFTNTLTRTQPAAVCAATRWRRCWPIMRSITARTESCCARFETLYLTGWAPHESQQKPLKPGSAKTRLADALGARRTG